MILIPGNTIEKTQVLEEALRLLKTFQGKTFVIKCGGSLIKDNSVLMNLLGDIATLQQIGIQVILVHGGGPEINIKLAQLGKSPKSIQGLRYTDEETMEVVEMVLAGSLNKKLVNRMQQLGIPSIGICGKDGGLFLAEMHKIENQDLGLVGHIAKVNPKIINLLLQNQFLPVIAPIASDSNGQTLNINADEAAVDLAIALKSEKLIFMTDVPGILRILGDPNSSIPVLSVQKIPELIESGILQDGILPKVKSCAKAIQHGIQNVHILNGHRDHALLLGILTQEGIGTLMET